MFRCIWQSGSWGNCVRGDSDPLGTSEAMVAAPLVGVLDATDSESVVFAGAGHVRIVVSVGQVHLVGEVEVKVKVEVTIVSGTPESRKVDYFAKIACFTEPLASGQRGKTVVIRAIRTFVSAVGILAGASLAPAAPRLENLA